MTAKTDKEAEPYTVIDHRAPVKGSAAGFTWRATWRGHLDWEGSDVDYRDIYAAFPLVLAQYVWDEYGYLAGQSPAEGAPDAVYAWRCARGVWRLYENNEDTGVWLTRREVVGL